MRLVALIRPILLLLLCASAPAANLVTSVLTVTNLPQTSNVFFFSSSSASSLRVWTNQTTASTILTNLAGLGPAATNLFNALGNYPLAGITSISQTNTNTLVFKGTSLVVTQGGNWASIVSTTNTGTNVYSLALPFDSLAPATRTNEASELIYGLSQYPTNTLPTNAVALTNHATLGVPYGGGEQTFTSRKYFAAGAGVANLGATNGYTSSLTNINPVNTNLINYGNAIRSEGPGANSFQAGSNAMALGPRSIAIGNNSSATNTDAFQDAVSLGTSTISSNGIAIGNSSVSYGSIVVGNSSTANNGNLVLGNSSTATGSGAINVGGQGDGRAIGANGLNIGIGSQSLTNNCIAIGYYAVAGGGASSSATAIGDSSWARHSYSVALGANTTTTTNHQVRLGTSSEYVSIPGMLEVAGGISNLTTAAGSTNLIYGSLTFPRYDVSTLAAGNNISVPLGTNTYIRLAPGALASSPTLCGLIGGATSGGENGETKFIFNDTGFSVTFAVSTADPIPANRISTYNSTDYSLINQGFAQIFYDAVSARWKLASVWPQTNFVANATNAAVANLNSFATNLTLWQTTVIPSAGNLTMSNLTASRALLMNSALQVTNEPDATLFNLSSLPIKNYTNSLTSLRTNSVSVGSVTGINYGFGLTGVVASSELRLGLNPPSQTQLWMGNGPSTSISAGIYKYGAVSGQYGTTVLLTNTSVATYPAANLTITGLGITTGTLLLGTGTNLTIALQTNGIDAFTAVLTGNASRTHALVIGQSISVTTNDSVNIRFTADGAVAGQTYGTTVSYTIP